MATPVRSETMEPAGDVTRTSTRATEGLPPAIWVLILAVAIAPAFSDNKFLLFQATQAGIYMIVAIGLNVVAGYAGQTSLAQGALVAVGAYTSAILMVKFQFSFWVAAALATCVTSLCGGLVALPALRLSTWYFALISLTFASVVGELIIEWRSFTGGFNGILGIPRPALFGYTFTDRGLFLLVLSVVVGAFWIVQNLVRSRMGRAMIAVRDNPLAATASGASLLNVKMFAFVVSAALAGIGGAFFAVQKTVISVDDFGTDFSIFFLLIVVVGGSGRLWGPIVGTLMFFLLPEFLGPLQSWRMLVYGALLLLLMLFAPDGVVGALERAWRRRPRVIKPDRPDRTSNLREPGILGAALTVTGITKRFGGVQALDGVSLVVQAGSTSAIVGPNGSGKTTLLNMISGFFRADAGSVLLGDTPLKGRPAHAVARLGVGRTFQTPKLLGQMTVLENVLLGTYPSEQSTVAAIALSLPSARKEAASLRALAFRYLNFVGLAGHAHALADEIPHGQQRLLEIARALMGRPRLLLLDEPAAGLSMSELERLGGLIKEIASQGTSVLIVEHHLELVGEICNHVTVLDRGRILASGSAKEVFNHPEVLTAYMGVSTKAAQ
jgi:branched-chain amino acid transport system permease protein